MSIDRPHDLEAIIEATRALREPPIDAGKDDMGAAGVEGGDVRLEKVAKVRAALAAGNYIVPAGAVAIKMLDSMLALEQKRVLDDRRKEPRVGHRRLMRGRARRGIC